MDSVQQGAAQQPAQKYGISDKVAIYTMQSDEVGILRRPQVVTPCTGVSQNRHSLCRNPKAEMTASVQENESKPHKRLNRNTFYLDKTKQSANFRHMLPLTKRQTDRQIFKTRKLQKSVNLSECKWIVSSLAEIEFGSSFLLYNCQSTCHIVKGNWLIDCFKSS